MVKERDDIIHDILNRVIEASQINGGITEGIASQIEAKVRSEWAGSRPYITQNLDQKILLRNKDIYKDYWEKNLRDVKRLAVRYGISVKQIRRIIF